MRILVTGGFGFLGSYLVEELVKDKGNLVHVVDNLSTSPLDLDDFLQELGDPSNLDYTICSIKDFNICFGFSEKYDQIYHLASVVGPVGVLPYGGNIVRSIVNNTYRVIALALKNKAKLVDVSTSEIYGGGRDGYCSEELSSIIQPDVTIRLEYAIAKLASEIAIINTCKVKSLEASIVRPFNIAGPRQLGDGGFVLPRFVSQALDDEPLTVFGDGLQVRAFTHVKDVASGLIKVMEKGKSAEKYNLGNPANKITILELAERVIELTNSKSMISFVDPKTIYGDLYAEANDKFPNSDRIMALGWKPQHNINKIIFDKIKEKG